LVYTHTHTSVEETLTLACSVAQSATKDQSDGSVVLLIEGGTFPYNISWTGAQDGGIIGSAEGETTINNLSAGSYIFSVLSNGETATCSIVVPEKQTINAGDCINLGDDLPSTSPEGDAYCYKWSPTTYFDSGSNASDKVITTCPTNNITYTVTVTDGLNITETWEYEICVEGGGDNSGGGNDDCEDVDVFTIIQVDVSSLTSGSSTTFSTDGDLTTVTQTTESLEPWIDYSFDAPYNTPHIKLQYPSGYNANAFYVLYSDVEFSSTELETETTNSNNQFKYVNSYSTSFDSITLGENIRYIRIQASGTASLSIAEIDIPVAYIPDPDKTEICGNGIDDDCDGRTDCEDSDCSPTISNVAITHPTCPVCNDGEINIQAFGQNLEYSIDGGNTYQSDDTFTNLLEGDYNLVVKQDNCIVEYENTIELRSPSLDSCEEDNPDCPNGGFCTGTLSGWSGCTGQFDKKGKVTFQVDIPDLSSSTQNMHSVVNTAQQSNDPNVPSIELQPPSGGDNFMRLGDNANGSNFAKAEYCFTVTANNSDFNFFYSVVLQNPEDHKDREQPYFQYEVCNSSGNPVFDPVKIVADKDNPFFQVYEERNREPWVYKIWTCENFDLSGFIGEEICVKFTVADCTLGGHIGYAYIDGLCDNSVDPITALDAPNTLCRGSVDGLTVDGSESAGENQYTWTVCKNGNTDCVSESFFNEAGILDIEEFYTSNGGNFTYDTEYTITLETQNDCGMGQSESVTVFVTNGATVEYNNFIYCTTDDIVPIQGTNTCNGCIHEWTTDFYTILDDPSSPFPNITVFPSGNAPSELKITSTDPNTGCVYEDNFVVRKLDEIRLVDFSFERVDYCELQFTANVCTNIPIDELDFALTNNTTGDSFSHQSITLTNPADDLSCYEIIYNITGYEGATDNSEYYFNIDLGSNFDGFDQYGCEAQSASTFVDELLFFGDISQMFFPNSFSPNGDGINDIWQVFSEDAGDFGYGAYNATYFELTIYSRWGTVNQEIAYQITSLADPWLGFQQGAVQWDGLADDFGNSFDNGVYVFTLCFRNCTHDIKNDVSAGDWVNPADYEGGVVPAGDKTCFAGSITIAN